MGVVRQPLGLAIVVVLAGRWDISRLALSFSQPCGRMTVEDVENKGMQFHLMLCGNGCEYCTTELLLHHHTGRHLLVLQIKQRVPVSHH